MTQFMTRYFLQEVSAWIVFTPFPLSLMLLIGVVSELPLNFMLVFVILSSVIVFSKYNEVRKNHRIMFALFPLRIRELLNTDVAFMSLITFCYSFISILLTAILTILLNNQFIFASMEQLLLLVGCCFILIAINLLFIWINSPSISLIFFCIIFSTGFYWEFIIQLSLLQSVLMVILSGGFLLCCYLIVHAVKKRGGLKLL